MSLCVVAAVGSGCFVDSSGYDPTGPGNPRAGCAEACQNGGVCVGRRCFCGPVDYQGPTCEEQIDDCAGVDCGNGECVDLVRDYACNCAEGWTFDDDGICTVEVVSCATANACVNGTCSDDGGVVECQCSLGFKGTNCGVVVTCEEPPAPPPNAVEAGRSGTTEFGDTVTFACKSGFEPASTTIACQLDETWQTPILDCVDQPGCGTPPPIEYGDVSTPEGNDVGAVAYYTCDPGFFLVAYLDNNTITCLETLEWSVLWGSCLLIGTCADDPCIHGTCTDYDSTVPTFECTCDPGWSDPTCAK